LLLALRALTAAAFQTIISGHHQNDSNIEVSEVLLEAEVLIYREKNIKLGRGEVE